MKRILQPEQIIVPGEYELANESILKIYFRAFNRECGGQLPPVLVTHKKRINPSFLGGRYSKKYHPDEFYQRLMDSEAEYLLLDGNHRSVSATLCHNPIYCLDLEKRADIANVRRMVRSGELFDFPHDKNSLTEIANDFIGYIFQDKVIMTVRERVEKLTSNGDIPKYMRERYHRNK